MKIQKNKNKNIYDKVILVRRANGRKSSKLSNFANKKKLKKCEKESSKKFWWQQECEVMNKYSQGWTIKLKNLTF